MQEQLRQQKTLAKSVYSINTSKVTEDGTEDEKNGKEEESGNDGNPSVNKRVAIEGMQIVVGKQKKAMRTKMESMEEEEDDDEEDGEDNQGKGEEVEEQEGKGRGSTRKNAIFLKCLWTNSEYPNSLKSMSI
jgi:hypothetical protein